MTELYELEDNDKRFRILADSMPQIVWTARPDGWVDYYNQRWFDYTGMSGRETHGWGWGLAVHQDNLDTGIQRWQQAVNSGLPFEMLVRLKRKADGAYRWHLVRALPARDNCGRIIKWFGSCTDIDDLKRGEQELQTSATELARLLEERGQLLAIANEHLLLEMQTRKQAVASQQQTQLRLNHIIRTQALLAQTPFDVSHFATIVVELLLKLVSAEAAMVAMLDDDALICRAAGGSTSAQVGQREQANCGLSGRCVRDGEPVVATDGDGVARGSIALAPLFKAGRVVGVVKVVASAGSAFGSEQIQLLQVLAGLMSAALAIT